MEAEHCYWKALGKLFGSGRISLFTVHSIYIHTADFSRKVRTVCRGVDTGSIGFCIMLTSIRGLSQAHGQDRRTRFKMAWTSSCKDRPSWNIKRIRLCNRSRTP
jgi:hypothetical protein